MTPLMRAAFVGHAATVELLLNELNEIEDGCPDAVRKEHLDQRTLLGFTAYMIACECGHVGLAKAFEAKGCSTGLVNAFGRNGDALLQESCNSD